MLTLFDYLRKRAFEAVIDGTQDAVDFLENQQRLDQAEITKIARKRLRPPAVGDQRNGAGTDGPNRDADNSTSPGENPNENLPAPRRRGRPRKNANGEQ